LRDIYVNKHPNTLPQRLQLECGISQPALFIKRSTVKKIGAVNKDLHYCMDYEYWIRCTKVGLSFAFIPEYLSIARYHIDNKTYGMRGHSYQEVCEMLKDHFNYFSAAWLMRYTEYLVEGLSR
jgi:hypothetical protein